jgi:hypothetical protein
LVLNKAKVEPTWWLFIGGRAFACVMARARLVPSSTEERNEEKTRNEQTLRVENEHDEVVYRKEGRENGKKIQGGKECSK